MRLSVLPTAMAFGLLWGASILLVGVVNLAAPGYGVAFLDVARSIYPGFAHSSGPVGVVVGTLYGLVDGAVGGILFAVFYNYFARQSGGPSGPATTSRG